MLHFTQFSFGAYRWREINRRLKRWTNYPTRPLTVGSGCRYPRRPKSGIPP